MLTDVKFLAEIQEAVEEGKLELSDWESGFIESIQEYIDYRELSPKQRQALDRIHEKIRPW